MKTVKIIITGIVQGVGFRPFIYKSAVKHSIKGFVKNAASNIIIEAQGRACDIDFFIENIKSTPPVASFIQNMEVSEITVKDFSTFEITESSDSDSSCVFISPDLATCNDCLKELFDNKDRRFNYPFINCTNCGPRFTIIEKVPYDRPNTSMKIFPMCKECLTEYNDPMSRRFHAQPNACNNCGPSVTLFSIDKKIIDNVNPIKTTVALLKQGNIVAIKGVGGYHLAVCAKDEKAVMALRNRKGRDERPFAMMAKDMDAIKKVCKVSIEEENSLLSIKAPIVILPTKGDTDEISSTVSSQRDTFGFMLPYTPLHSLLLNELDCILVMTSGNFSDNPLCYNDETVFKDLNGIADYVLTNERPIHIRCDDSVIRIFEKKEYPIRRSRGYVPQGIQVPLTINKRILACGGELKNTVCLLMGEQAVLSQHIGDLVNADNDYEKTISHMCEILNFTPETLAFDLHSEYLSSKYAKMQQNKKLISIQHHHAHMAACMADNFLSGDVIGVIFDGLGMGEDDKFWGGEFLTGSYARYSRIAHFEYMAMPGGEAAIKEPWRMALSLLSSICGIENIWNLNIPIPYELSSAERIIFEKMLKKPMYLTSSLGRIFDAVSAMLGIKGIISYEGEAAILLEKCAEQKINAHYNFRITKNEPWQICLTEMYREIMQELENNVSKSVISAKFHNSIAYIVSEVCCAIRDKSNLDRVVLSGGVFQNMLLLSLCKQKLINGGFKVYIHEKVPANDGGLALGQAVIAAARS